MFLLYIGDCIGLQGKLSSKINPDNVTAIPVHTDCKNDGLHTIHWRKLIPPLICEFNFLSLRDIGTVRMPMSASGKLCPKHIVKLVEDNNC